MGSPYQTYAHLLVFIQILPKLYSKPSGYIYKISRKYRRPKINSQKTKKGILIGRIIILCNKKAEREREIREGVYIGQLHFGVFYFSSTVYVNNQRFLRMLTVTQFSSFANN